MDAIILACDDLAHRLLACAVTRGEPLAAVIARLDACAGAVLGRAQCMTLSTRARHQLRTGRPAPAADVGVDGGAVAAALGLREAQDCAAFIGLLCLFLGEDVTLRLLGDPRRGRADG